MILINAPQSTRAGKEKSLMRADTMLLCMAIPLVESVNTGISSCFCLHSNSHFLFHLP